MQSNAAALEASLLHPELMRGLGATNALCVELLRLPDPLVSRPWPLALEDWQEACASYFANVWEEKITKEKEGR